jgi:CTP synthase (UTP-ammonia lyase)
MKPNPRLSVPIDIDELGKNIFFIGNNLHSEFKSKVLFALIAKRIFFIKGSLFI